MAEKQPHGREEDFGVRVKKPKVLGSTHLGLGQYQKERAKKKFPKAI